MNHSLVESIMIPVAVPRELLGDTLAAVILRRRSKVSFPSNILSKKTGTVTELVLLPAGNMAGNKAELKSIPAGKHHSVNQCMAIVFTQPAADTGGEGRGSTSARID